MDRTTVFSEWQRKAVSVTLLVPIKKGMFLPPQMHTLGGDSLEDE